MPWLRPPRPVILLVFANDRGIDGAYLRQLDTEMDHIETALSFAEQAGRCRVEVVHNATHDRFFQAVTRHGRRIIGVHFAGHADPGGLRLDDGQGGTALAGMEGIADLLTPLRRLRWVFLNGCGTAEHVGVLHSRLSTPIVATECAIRDDLASDFARQFYRSIAHSQTLQEAYDVASARLRSAAATASDTVRGGVEAGPFFEPGADYRFLRPAEPATEWPWALHLPPNTPAAGAWRLPADPLSSLIRPLALGVLALLCLLVAIRVAVDLYGIWDAGRSASVLTTAVAAAAPGGDAMGPDAVASAAGPPDAAVPDAIARDAMAPDASAPDAAPSHDAISPDADPPDAREAAAREAAARKAAARKAAVREAAARKATAISGLTRQFEDRLAACDCPSAKAKASALASSYGVDKDARWRAACARQPTPGRCAHSLSARITEHLSACRCDTARPMVLRLRDAYGIDRNGEWARRCAIPNLPGSCL